MIIEKTVQEILSAKKYSGLDRSVVERICSQIAPRYTKHKDAIKAIKTELHIIYGAFLSRDCHARAGSLIDGYIGEDIYSDRDFAARLMELHISTAERAADAEGIYSLVSDWIRPDDTLTDIGCGFNPFALPFLKNMPKSYIAYDICTRTINLLNRYFAPLCPRYRAELSDAITQIPPDLLKRTQCEPAYEALASLVGESSGSPVGEAVAPLVGESAGSPVGETAEPARVIFMFKIFPLLEQQKKGRAFELLRTMEYQTAIISFPTKSSSGRERGMEAFYTDMFHRGLPDGLTILDKAVFNNEMFFIVRKQGI